MKHRLSTSFAVKPARLANNRESYRLKWWLYAESRPAMRTAFARHARYIATCMVAKHRIFVWLDRCLPVNAVIAFALIGRPLSSESCTLEFTRVWARARGTQLREKESGLRYTPTTCFETFPFPEPTRDQSAAISAAAKELDDLRSALAEPAGVDEDGGLRVSRLGRWAVGAVCRRARRPRHRHGPLAAVPCPKTPTAPPA